LKFLIAELINHHGADPEKIFMVGASNGGLMTMRFACEAGEYLRAAASVNSEIPAKQAANCSIPEPLPWLAINADHDPVVPFQGMVAGTVEDGHLQPELEPALLSFAFFADAAGCSPDVYTETLNALTEERVRSNCASGNSSIEYILHDASHAWPTEGIDPAAVIWAHFNQTLTIKTLSASN
jgi:polyhydroxybutyrate depolymerase